MLLLKNYLKLLKNVIISEILKFYKSINGSESNNIKLMIKKLKSNTIYL